MHNKPMPTRMMTRSTCYACWRSAKRRQNLLVMCSEGVNQCHM